MENNSFSNTTTAAPAAPAAPATPATLSTTTNVSEPTMWEIPTSDPASSHHLSGANISDDDDDNSTTTTTTTTSAGPATTTISAWAAALPPPPAQFAHAPPDAETTYTIQSALSALDEGKAQLDALRACGSQQREREQHRRAAHELLVETAATIRRALARLRAAERNLARAARDVEVALGLGVTGGPDGLRVERAGRNYPRVVLRLEKVLRRMRREAV